MTSYKYILLDFNFALPFQQFGITLFVIYFVYFCTVLISLVTSSENIVNLLHFSVKYNAYLQDILNIMSETKYEK
jgi:hypothetical protein